MAALVRYLKLLGGQSVIRKSDETLSNTYSKVKTKKTTDEVLEKIGVDEK